MKEKTVYVAMSADFIITTGPFEHQIKELLTSNFQMLTSDLSIILNTIQQIISIHYG